MILICEMVYYCRLKKEKAEFCKCKFAFRTIDPHAIKSYNLHEFRQTHVPWEESAELYVVVCSTIANHGDFRLGHALWNKSDGL